MIACLCVSVCVHTQEYCGKCVCVCVWNDNASYKVPTAKKHVGAYVIQLTGLKLGGENALQGVILNALSETPISTAGSTGRIGEIGEIGE